MRYIVFNPVFFFLPPHSVSKKGEPKGNQKGTLLNVLPINGFNEIHRLNATILVPPKGNH